MSENTERVLLRVDIYQAALALARATHAEVGVPEVLDLAEFLAADVSYDSEESTGLKAEHADA